MKVSATQPPPRKLRARPLVWAIAIGLMVSLTLAFGSLRTPSASRTAGSGGGREAPPQKILTAAHPPVPPPAGEPGPTGPELIDELRQKDLLVPLAGRSRESLSDNFLEARGKGRIHQAIDLVAPRGTPVLAVEGGVVRKLFTSVPGGLTVYQYDPTSSWCYYYAHLDGYAPGISEGSVVRRGEVLGYVGTTGNAPKNAPHLHFAIYRLGAGKRWWEGAAVNPYQVWQVLPAEPPR